MEESAPGYDGKLAMDNREIASVLRRIADLLEFTDENPFKLRSYRMAAETIGDMAHPIAEIALRGAAGLQEIPGIGKTISSQILEIIRTGTSGVFEELKTRIPESVLELRSVSGIGLKTSQLLYRDFGIKSLRELKAFADGGGLASVPGIGDKVIARIKSSVARLEGERGKLRLNEAIETATNIADALKSASRDAGSPGSPRIEVVGQIRRGCELIDHIEMLACGDLPLLSATFAGLPSLTDVTTRVRPFPEQIPGGGPIEALTKKGIGITLYLVPEADFAAAMLRTTGSAEHLRDLETAAETRGYLFAEFQLAQRRSRGTGTSGRAKLQPPGDRVPVSSEDEFYRLLGLQYVAPELREGLGEVALAGKGALPELICLEDMRGDFHMHTTWSDGQNSIREMIEAARRQGYEYIAVTDHTQATAIANGNTPEQLLAEIAEIEAIAGEYDDIRVLKGAEVDILSDGTLDMPPDVLDRLDWIVVSIHGGFQQPKQQITDRVIRAMESGYANVFGHPTGRILGQRAGYEIDLEQVIEAARQYDVRMELNASPHRLDLNSHWLRIAKKAGVGFVISTDSHRVAGLEAMRYGISTARRAGLTKDDVLNTLPAAALLANLDRKKSQRKARAGK